MSERWIGISVTGDRIVVVGLSFNGTDSFTVVEDETWTLQAGDRAQAYRVMLEKVVNYLTENGIQNIVIKASAANQQGMSLAHLTSAELRGVVIAAAAKAAQNIHVMTKATEYVDDDSFWEAKLEQTNLRKGSRETALIILMAKKQ